MGKLYYKDCNGQAIFLADIIDNTLDVTVGDCCDISSSSSTSNSNSSSSSSSHSVTGNSACGCEGVPDNLKITIVSACACLNRVLPLPLSPNTCGHIGGCVWLTEFFNECSGGSMRYDLNCSGGHWTLSTPTTICINQGVLSDPPISISCDPFKLIWNFSGDCPDCGGAFTGTLTVEPE